MRKFYEYAGIAASVVLIAIGIGAIWTGADGRSTVRDNLAAEQISGTPDMTPSAIAAAAKEAGLKNVAIPDGSVAGKTIDTGARARLFAQYMRIHALEATGGQVYAQMGRFLDGNGKPTNDQQAAAKDPKSGQPVENPVRNVWVTETALSTALNTSYFAENVATFAIVMGIAMVLSGVGFLVLTLKVLGGPKAAKERAPVRAQVAGASS
jgi:hypothetical protein